MEKGRVSILAVVMFLTLTSFASLATISGGAAPEDTGAGDVASQTQPSDDRAYFVRNDGQWGTDLDYTASTAYGAIGFSEEGVFMNVIDEVEAPDEGDGGDVYTSGTVVQLSFVNGDASGLVGKDMLEGRMNFLIGPESDWAQDVPIFTTVSYQDVWPGIDVNYHAGKDGVKYDILLAPNADPSQIEIAVSGHESLYIEDGELVISVSGGQRIVDGGLDIWYNDGSMENVNGRVQLSEESSFTFALDNYDQTRGLVIDPLYYATFIGGYDTDYGYGVSSDMAGCAYLTGYTYYSSTQDFPTTSGAYYRTRSISGYDAFVTKFNYAGTALVYSTFVGGRNTDYCYGIDVDSSGYAYITGYTYYDSSYYVQWPVTSGAYRTSFTYTSYPEAFVTKLNTAGSGLSYSTYIGGAYYDYSYGIAVDSSGCAAITGQTQYYSSYSPSYGDWPTTSGAYQSSRIYYPSGSTSDAFLTKFNSAGSGLLFSTFIGGGNTDYGYAVAYNASGEIAVTGYTYYDSTRPFPTTSGAYQTTIKGSVYFDVFVCVFKSNYGILYATLIGGGDYDYGRGVDFDSQGRVVVGGYYWYVSSNPFPTTSGAYQTTFAGGTYDCFIAKFRYHGTALLFSTYLGGSGSDYSVTYHCLELDAKDNVYFAGYTASTNFPTKNALQSSIKYSTYNDAFLTNLSADGSSISFSTYYGGAYYEYAYGMDVDRYGIASVTGYSSYSSSYTPTYGDFPTTVGAYQRTRVGTGNEVFLFRYGENFGNTVKPTLGTDSSDATAYTGTLFRFTTTASDDIGVWKATVEYWYDAGGHTNLSLSLLSPYTATATMQNALGTLYYFFSVSDVNGNWASGPTKSRTLVDATGPTFSNVAISNTPTTGEQVTVYADVTDNVAVQSGTVYLYYRSTYTSTYTSALMSFVSGNTYSVTVTAGSSWVGAYIYFTARDTSNNLGTSGLYYTSVIDNDAPTFVSDASPTSGTTGDPYTFSLNLNDNVGIAYAFVEYWFGSAGSHTQRSMTISGTGQGSDQTATLTITIPSNSDDDMTYFYNFMDNGGNYWTSGPSGNNVVVITDNDMPGISSVQSWYGYTGDPFYFSVWINDNVEGVNVKEGHALYTYNYDWDNAMNVSLTLNSGNSRWESATFNVNLNSLDPITYYVSTTDHTGNWGTYGPYLTYVMDNDLPGMDSEQSQASATTGDPFEFNVSVSDNIGIGQVDVHYYYDDGTIDTTVGMLEGDGYYTVTVELVHSLAEMDYEFLVYDTSYNMITTSEFSRTPSDNDLPEIFNDMSPLTGEAGHTYSFRVMVTDNIDLQLSTLKVSYRYSTGSTTSVMLDRISGNIFGKTIDLISVAGTLYYTFTATDGSGNVHTTPEMMIEVLDITPPTLEGLSFADVATTGDSYTVTVTATDDVSLTFVRMYYYFGDAPGTVQYIEGTASGDTYTLVLTIPDELTTLHFSIVASDEESNLNQLPYLDIPVEDNDMPSLDLDLTTASPTTGDPITFAAQVSDNIELASVIVSYSMPDGTSLDSPCDLVDLNFTYTAVLSNAFKGELTYRFRITDTSGNVLETDPAYLTVKDDELPVVNIVGPSMARQNDPAFFDGSGTTENVMIMNWTWAIDGNLFYTPSVAYSFPAVGTYTVTLSVLDDPDHPAVTGEFTIVITDSELPIALAEIPERIGNHEVMVANATGSTDNVGIVKYVWTLFLPDGSRIGGEGAIFSYDMTGILGQARLRLEVYDAEDNRDTENYIVSVVDLLAPSVVTPDDVDDFKGAALRFSDTDSTDNVGIVDRIWNVTWEGGYKTFVGKTLSFYFETPGIYNISLTCVDYAGNEGTNYFLVTISDKTAAHDTDGDGLPDAWEDEYGLDKFIDDSQRDPDGDSLNNEEEYALGTDPMKEDTDDDGLPDDWEDEYGFDPVSTNDANLDPDEDGDSNIVEYAQGNRDPTAEDAAEETEDKTALYIVLIVVAFIVVLVVLAAVIFYFTKLPTVPEGFPEEEYPHLYKKQ